MQNLMAEINLQEYDLQFEIDLNNSINISSSLSSDNDIRKVISKQISECKGFQNLFGINDSENSSGWLEIISYDYEKSIGGMFIKNTDEKKIHQRTYGYAMELLKNTTNKNDAPLITIILSQLLKSSLRLQSGKNHLPIVVIFPGSTIDFFVGNW